LFGFFFDISLGTYAMEYGIVGRVAEMATLMFAKHKVRELMHLPPVMPFKLRKHEIDDRKP